MSECKHEYPEARFNCYKCGKDSGCLICWTEWHDTGVCKDVLERSIDEGMVVSAIEEVQQKVGIINYHTQADNAERMIRGQDPIEVHSQHAHKIAVDNSPIEMPIKTATDIDSTNVVSAILKGDTAWLAKQKGYIKESDLVEHGYSVEGKTPIKLSGALWYKGVDFA